MTQKPRLIVRQMSSWQSKILNFVGYLIGLRQGSVAWIDLHIVVDEYESDFEPTINDIVKNQEEDEANSVRDNN